MYDEYLSKGIFAISIKHVAFLIEGYVMPISIDGARSPALFCGALPYSALTSAIRDNSCQSITLYIKKET